ncbi:MAG: hypothetical protein EOP67_03285 [Sphingomonas sp.]|nr:MAG: hypothetical protein EOP67_03285 [Sphingomonas sp.]
MIAVTKVEPIHTARICAIRHHHAERLLLIRSEAARKDQSGCKSDARSRISLDIERDRHRLVDRAGCGVGMPEVPVEIET